MYTPIGRLLAHRKRSSKITVVQHRDFVTLFSSDSLSATPSCVMPCEVCRLAAAAAVNELLDDDDRDDKGKARWQIGSGSLGVPAV